MAKQNAQKQRKKNFLYDKFPNARSDWEAGRPEATFAGPIPPVGQGEQAALETEGALCAVGRHIVTEKLQVQIFPFNGQIAVAFFVKWVYDCLR